MFFFRKRFTLCLYQVAFTCAIVTCHAAVGVEPRADPGSPPPKTIVGVEPCADPGSPPPKTIVGVEPRADPGSPPTPTIWPDRRLHLFVGANGLATTHDLASGWEAHY